jgi:hypothetical protein
MGQQQLLLVILVTIVVGIATVVALNIFGSSAEQANHDAVRQDMAQIATSSQGWFIKPAMLGGGNNSFEEIDFRRITFPGEINATNNLISTNLNGTYIISDRTEDGFLVTGYPSSQSDYTSGQANTDWFEVYVTRGNMSVSPSLGEPAPGQPTED